MPLFQSTVVSKYLKSQDRIKLVEKWELYKSHFLNPVIQENIRNSKEEQYQEGFLRDLFVKILGYTLNPEHNFNLTTELKNVKDSKKADGGIIINEKVIGVVELKGTNTTDLGKVEEQAFGYKNNQSECIYVITSNFEKLRFYIDNAIEHTEFNLFTITEQDFQLLYLCLAFENVKNNIPKKLKEESLSQEELITKQLYKDYSLFKRELFQNLCELNPQFEPLELFKKSQKLLDRCLFLLFSEDRNLLPPNSVRLILKQWKQLHELDAYSPLYDRFKKYFGYLNTGFKGKQYDVFAYNGGLFKPDAVLDTITIDDDLLYRHTYKLSEYDFQSEVDVNILGHIFENSLNELDEVSAKLEGLAIDKSNTKRKKDGVFYTPKYITKYIVENTIGKLCEEKKAELDITDEAYQPAKQRSRKRLDNLNLYRNWLLQLTICDPACGSGAFLNQALDFLINEHRYIDELSAKYNKDTFILSDVEKSILENNLFGVDLNEESVEIAKLSLWLRTAQPNRKLNDLSDNIKCGNSLIDDVSVAGDKAFNWEKEFPQIFAKGGFDVIIGNPPYISHDRIDNKNFLKDNFISYSAFGDLYIFFYELAHKILNSNGISSLITSNSFLKAEYGKPLRHYFKEYSNIEQVINIENTQIFSDAIVNTVILTFKKTKTGDSALVVNSEYRGLDFNTFIEENKMKYSQNDFLATSWNLTNPNVIALQNKIKGKNKTLEEYNTKIKLGIATGDNNAFVIDENLKNELVSKNTKNQEIIKPILRGRDIERYYYDLPNLYLLLTKNGINVQTEYPDIYEYLNSFGDKFKTRGAKGQHWTNLRACSFFDDFKLNKIVWIELTDKGRFTTCDDEIYLLNSAYFLIPPEVFETNFLLTVLNSSLIEFYLKQIANTSGMGTTRWINNYVKEFPIPELSKLEQQPFITRGKQMLLLNKGLQEGSAKFQRALQREFEQLDKLSKKLENWYDLSYADFLKELKKKKIELSLSQKAEWEDYFLSEQKKAVEIQNQITSTDKEIDAMVYELYGLSEEEIAIVENS